MKTIADFSPTERQLVAQALFERYGRQVTLEDAEAELELEPDSDELTLCPAIYWEERGAHFVVFKTGNSRFRAQFFYSEAQQFGTGKEEFDNLGDCIVTLLQVQSDHERQMKGIRSGMTALDFEDDYNGPLIV
ncbi:MAG: hypothetical protein WDA11_03840 [Thiohalomonadaceae bacterium]